MTPNQWQRIQELFEAAARLSSRERKAFLKRECADDTELEREVERLLLNHENPTGFLAHPLIPSGSLSEGDVIAKRYWIISLIGRGGMGEVYEAEDQVLRESVAIKKLRPELSNNETVVRQFQKEIQLARRITHPNICRVFDVGSDEPTSRRSRILFFSMELLDGETLAAKIHREGRLSRETAFAIAVQIADGLAAAHSAGVVHTDFKSGNVILVPTPEGSERAVITDFGLARRDPAMLAADTTRTMVQEGQIAGTVAYMSPEQLQGGTITPASDIYSFGIVLFEMATGLLPFDDRRVIHSAMQRADPQTVSVRALVPDIDARWEQAITRCLRKNPEDRFQSAAELADWLRGGPWWEPRLWTRRDWIKAGSAAAVSLASGGGLWVWSHRPYQPNASALQWYDSGQKAMHSMTYEAARKRLEQSIKDDPMFALAHASLARAYDELDYSDRAKELMLRAVTAAQETRLSKIDELRLRALQFMVSRDYERAVPLFNELESEAQDMDKASAALESGWLAQQREDTAAAEAAYERALKLDPNYAAAKLRLGFILQRRGVKDELPLKAFSEAETLFGAASDYEGITETLYSRANLLNRRSHAREALPIIDRAIGTARTVGNRYQEIRLLLLQGTALRNMGQSQRAVEMAQAAIDAAVAENMDNLASSGLLDLGNAFLFREDLMSAEPFFRRALELARHGKVRRNEARAKGALGSLFEQDHKPEQAKPFAEDVLTFYRQAGFRRELIQTLAVLTGIHEQLGDYEKGVSTAREALVHTVELKDNAVEANVRERLGRNLAGLGSWPDALEEDRRAAELYVPAIRGADARLACVQLYARLGRRDEAMRSLQEVQQEITGEQDAILNSIRARRAEMAYDERNWRETLSLAGRSVAPDSPGDEAGQDLSLFQTLALIRTKNNGAAESAANLIQKFDQQKLAGKAAEARLLIAEALLANGDRNRAQQLLVEAVRFFEPRQNFESLWRAHVLTARASNDPREAAGQRAQAEAAFTRLKARWGAESMNGYMRRPAIQQLSAEARS